MTDHQLIEQASRGNHEAFHALVDRYAPRLFRAAIMMTGNENDAQDLLQETLLAVYEGLPRFEGRSSVNTWMTGIMMRQASRARRRDVRHRSMVSLESPAVAEPAADSRSSDITRSDARMDLFALMQHLSAEHRDVLVLREIQALSYDEIAQMLDVPRGTVESRLSRARHALKQLAMQRMDSGSTASHGGDQ